MYAAKLLFHQSPTRQSETWQLDSDSVVTVVNCQLHSDYIAIGSSVTMLPVVIIGDYTATVQSLSLAGDWWSRSFAVYIEDLAASQLSTPSL